MHSIWRAHVAFWIHIATEPAHEFFQRLYSTVKYTVRATVKRAWRFDEKTESEITILGYVNILTFPRSIEPIEQTGEKIVCCWCCASGPIVTEMRMPKTGFLPGELIPVIVKVTNGSSRSIKQIQVILIQKLGFHATSKTTKKEHELVKLEKKDLNICCGNYEEWPAKLIVPADIPPSGLGGANAKSLIWITGSL